MLPPSWAIADPSAEPCWAAIVAVAPSSKPRLRPVSSIMPSTAATTAGIPIASRSRACGRWRPPAAAVVDERVTRAAEPVALIRFQRVPTEPGRRSRSAIRGCVCQAITASSAYAPRTAGDDCTGRARIPFGLIRKTATTDPSASAIERCGPGQPASSASPQVKYQGHAAGPPAAANSRSHPRYSASVGIRVRYRSTAPSTAVIATVTVPNADSTLWKPTLTPASRNSAATV